jgi:hypothetical protein
MQRNPACPSANGFSAWFKKGLFLGDKGPGSASLAVEVEFLPQVAQI